jgi:hypothetical protein
MNYLMNGPWMDTSREYYETVCDLASIVAQDECKRGLEHNYQLGLVRHVRFHEKILGCAGTLATSSHRIDAMKYAACTKEEAQKIVEEATRGNVGALFSNSPLSALSALSEA